MEKEENLNQENTTLLIPSKKVINGTMVA